MAEKRVRTPQEKTEKQYKAHRPKGGMEINELPPALNPSSAAGVKSGGPTPAFHDSLHHIKIFQGDCLEILSKFPDNSIDLIFADPPYMLSNNGITCHAGKMVSVNKGSWDKSRGVEENHQFNRAWLSACQRVLKPNGTIWVSGTAHIIHSIGFAMQQLGFKLLNDISWVKPNPPPNLSCRYFTHATETILWAAKSVRSKHYFNYSLMRELAGGRQMKSVWPLAVPGRDEKKFGRHPTQKPVALLQRILHASSCKGNVVLDPFLGSGTTAIASFKFQRNFVGIELSELFLMLSTARLLAEIVRVGIRVEVLKIDLDLVNRFMDRSESAAENVCMQDQLQARLVHREQKYFFIGELPREIIFSVSAESLEEAWKKFQESRRERTRVFSVIRTETEVFLAQ